jgi:hypothetical protein
VKAPALLPALAAAVAFVAVPSFAMAQYDRGPGPSQGYERRNEIRGVVDSFSPYNLYVNNGQHVILHNGTVINPTGITLRHGMRVRVLGHWGRDGAFHANEIDVVRGEYRR